MPAQVVRLSICRTAQEIANAKARDQTLGYNFIANSVTENTDVGLIANMPVNGEIGDLYVHIDANAHARCSASRHTIKKHG